MSFLSHSCFFFTVHIHTFSSRLFAVEKRYKVCVGGERKEDEKIVKKLEMWLFEVDGF